MSQQNERIKAFVASTTLVPYLRVVESTVDGTVAASGPYDNDVGINQGNALAAKDNVSVLLNNASGSRKVTTASTCAIGDRLFPTTGGMVDTLGANGLGTAGNAIGSGGFIALEACTVAGASGGIVEALPLEVSPAGGGRSVLFVGTGDSSGAGTSSNTEVFFDKNLVSLPANFFKKGDILNVKARIVATATHSTDTFAGKLYLGGVTLSAPTAFDAANSDEITMDVTVVVTDIGATGHVNGFGYSVAGTPGTATAREVSLSSTSIDTTGANVIRASITVSVSDPGNTAVLRDLIVTLERQ